MTPGGRFRPSRPENTSCEAAAQAVERDVTEALGTADAPAWRVVTATSGGDSASTLIELVTEAGADLLVLGSRRRTAVGKLFLGSTVQRVLIDAHFPVLVVKAESE